MVLSWKSLHGLRSHSRNPCLWAQFIHKCRLKPCHAKKKPYVNRIQKCRCLLWKCQHFSGNHGLQRRGTIELIISTAFKSLHHRCSTSGKAPPMLKGKFAPSRWYLPSNSRWVDIFHELRLCFFSKIRLNLLLKRKKIPFLVCRLSVSEPVCKTS